MVHREGEILYANLATADMFRAGDPAELVGRPVSDLLPPGEAEAFQAHIDALLDDEERRQRVGANGREHVVASYDRAAIAARLAEEIEWLIEWDETA
jgi:glycosyltransferase involved in cell wall biosynthesis